MNAVNLIPLDSRRSELPTLPGVPFLGLLGALAVALTGTIVYAHERGEVSSRQSELSQIQSVTAQWNAAASRYAPAITTVKQHEKRFVELGVLLGERADWSLLLSQLAGVMPAHAQLSSLAATASAPATSTTTSTSTATSTGSGITISGCAASQPAVANTMVALRRVSGVTAVNLASSALSSSGGSSGSASSGSCSLPVQFSLNLQFSPAVGAVQLLEGEGFLGAHGAQASTTAQVAADTKSTGAAQ